MVCDSYHSDLQAMSDSTMGISLSDMGTSNALFLMLLDVANPRGEKLVSAHHATLGTMRCTCDHALAWALPRQLSKRTIAPQRCTEP